jgi:hypothetical protein
MITVEDTIKQNTQKSTEAAKDNAELLTTGSVREVKKSYLPWILLALAAIGAGWYFLRKKGSGTNGETVPS